MLQRTYPQAYPWSEKVFEALPPETWVPSHQSDSERAQMHPFPLLYFVNKNEGERERERGGENFWIPRFVVIWL